MAATKEELIQAFEHGKSVGTFHMSSLGQRHAPLTFDSWYDTEFKPAVSIEPVGTVILKETP